MTIRKAQVLSWKSEKHRNNTVNTYMNTKKHFTHSHLLYDYTRREALQKKKKKKRVWKFDEWMFSLFLILQMSPLFVVFTGLLAEDTNAVSFCLLCKTRRPKGRHYLFVFFAGCLVEDANTIYRYLSSLQGYFLKTPTLSICLQHDLFVFSESLAESTNTVYLSSALLICLLWRTSHRRCWNYMSSLQDFSPKTPTQYLCVAAGFLSEEVKSSLQEFSPKTPTLSLCLLCKTSRRRR